MIQKYPYHLSPEKSVATTQLDSLIEFVGIKSNKKYQSLKKEI